MKSFQSNRDDCEGRINSASNNPLDGIGTKAVKSEVIDYSPELVDRVELQG
jgi:hypothetical protein